MFKQGQISVIDNFIDKDYQEKIKRELILLKILLLILKVIH